MTTIPCPAYLLSATSENSRPVRHTARADHATEGAAVPVDPAGLTPRRRGRPSRGVREAVLTATEGILVESGVARLSTRGGARRAGVAESSIFYHFGARLGLLQAVVQAQLPPLRQLLAEL